MVGQVGAAVVRWPGEPNICGNCASPFGDGGAQSSVQPGAMKVRCPAQPWGDGDAV